MLGLPIKTILDVKTVRDASQKCISISFIIDIVIIIDHIIIFIETSCSFCVQLIIYCVEAAKLFSS
jgi:hypothetical protein